MTTTSPLLTVHGISKSFGRATVLRSVDLTLTGGRVTALVGPNGSGKTTLIKTILGLVRAEAGDVRLDGESIICHPLARARIGYMPQAPRFPAHLSAREVIRLIASLRCVDPDVAVADAVAGFDVGAFLDQALGSCSGGQRQRVNAAVALLGAPEVLILDEPTAGLDPVASAALKDRIHRERLDGRAVLVSSHVLSDLEELADDVTLLLDGRVRFAGSLPGLKHLTGESTVERAIAKLMTRRFVLVPEAAAEVA